MVKQELLSRVYRLGLIAAVGLLVVQLVWRHRQGQAAPVEQGTKIHVGDSLPNVVFAAHTVGKRDAAAARDRSVKELAGGKCVLLAFFDSDCPACQEIAQDWAGRRILTSGAASLPIRWVATRTSDTAATNFIRQYDLANEWYSVRSLHDLATLGVFGTPEMYLVDEHLVLRKRTSWNPDSVAIDAASCEHANVSVHGPA